MDINASLSDSEGMEWPIFAMALHTGIGRFPRMFAQVESKVSPPPGALTFTLTESSNVAAAMADLSKSTWYVCACQVAVGQGRCLLMLMPDAACTLQLAPFAANEEGPQGLLGGVFSSGEITWDGESRASIEAFVSLWETPENLARRISRLVNESFRLVPDVNQGWLMKWGSALPALMQPGLPPLQASASLLVETSHSLERSVQCVGVPCDFDEALHTTAGSGGARSFLVHRPVQLGLSGSTAVSAEEPLSETGAALSTLDARWYALTDASELDALWRGSGIGTDLTQDVVLSSLFLYDGQSNGTRIGKASDLFMELLGGVAKMDHFGEGWAAYALAVPAESVPRETALVERLIELNRVAPIWHALTRCIGCGLHSFEPVAPAWPAFWPAVAINHPLDPNSGTVSRSEDSLSYRTKIWIRMLGVDGDLEVDWATPFASHDNSAIGGGGGGDLLLVPEANTLGYVSFLGTSGTPFFHLNTHYHDVTASTRVNPREYKHGLVIDAGLRVEEKRKDILLKARARITLNAERLLDMVGSEPKTSAVAVASISSMEVFNDQKI